MEREPTTSGNGQARSVARDVIDHASIIARDTLQIGKLEARRYAQHVRRDVAPKFAWQATAAVVGSAAVLCGLVAIFLGIAFAIGSAAWTFAIFAGFFAVVAVVMAALSSHS